MSDLRKPPRLKMTDALYEISEVVRKWEKGGSSVVAIDAVRGALVRCFQRELIAEWWELWWKKPNEPGVMIHMYGVSKNPLIPQGCFPTRALAVETKKKENNRYHVIVHVKRYRRIKG